MFRVIVSPTVSKRLGELALSRSTLLAVLNRMHDQLANHTATHRINRDPDDADLFDYVHTLYIEGRWRIIRFSVNDTRETDHLFVEAVNATT